jgi:hypothetical protein
MQHVDLDKTKVLKTQRDSKSELRKPNFKSVLKLSNRSDRYCTPVRSVHPILEQVQFTKLVRPLYRIWKIFTGLVRSWTPLVRWTIWPMEFELHQISPAITRHVWVLTQITQFRGFPSESALSQLGVTQLVWSVWWTRLIWQPQWQVFQKPIKGTPPHLSWVASSWPFA